MTRITFWSFFSLNPGSFHIDWSQGHCFDDFQASSSDFGLDSLESSVMEVGSAKSACCWASSATSWAIMLGRLHNLPEFHFFIWSDGVDISCATFLRFLRTPPIHVMISVEEYVSGYIPIKYNDVSPKFLFFFSSSPLCNSCSHKKRDIHLFH